VAPLFKRPPRYAKGGILIKIGIGIDTGGTYTDAVAVDFDSKAILSSAKALTTKEDLTIGILGALDALPRGLLPEAQIVSLSTTLATNACVEEKGGSAALIFFGGDRRVVEKYGKDYGLPPADEIYLQESYSDFSGGFEREPDWELFAERAGRDFTGLDGVGIIEKYAMKNSAIVEKKAKEIFLQKHSIPAVCGHELYNELNSLQRGASALLNARLFPVIRNFLAAIKAAAEARGIKAPIFIVRSDGSLMSEEFANVRPVETLLCGPAASVMGSAFLSNNKKTVVVDMGGTTTDIALVDGGVPVRARGGVQVGKWKTFVSGLYIKTLGLGGDSAVHYNDYGVILEDYRAVPLCVAAEKYPQITDNLKKLLLDGKKHMKFLHEHFMLVRDIADNPRYTGEEKAFCAALRGGPLILRDAAESVPGKDIFNFNATRLLKEGIVLGIGLTPTDIMHIKGDFVRYPAEASLLGAQFVAMNLDISVGELCKRVYDEVKRKLYINILKALMENREGGISREGAGEAGEDSAGGNSRERAGGDSRESAGRNPFAGNLRNMEPGSDLERFVNENYINAVNGVQNELVSMTLKTGFLLTGVGAPIRIFLHDVAKMLGTEAVIPEHYEVANALGAIAGSVSATGSVEVRPNYGVNGITGYTVSGSSETKVFRSIRKAEEFALAEAEKIAREEVIKRGARGEIDVTRRLAADEADTGEYRIYLGTRAIARAVGAAGLL